MEIRELVENFKAMPEWEDRYAYLVELGRALPQMAPEKKNEETRVAGCASAVWADYAIDDDGRHHFSFDSDALVVKGLLYVIYTIFEGKKAGETGKIDMEKIFDDMGLRANLSSQRLVGLASVIKRIRSLATKV
jgi:cysteine desulfuration protein SufE